jgi:hypothetical protein
MLHDVRELHRGMGELHQKHSEMLARVEEMHGHNLNLAHSLVKALSDVRASVVDKGDRGRRL